MEGVGGGGGELFLFLALAALWDPKKQRKPMKSKSRGLIWASSESKNPEAAGVIRNAKIPTPIKSRPKIRSTICVARASMGNMLSSLV
jgi:hypothetical protein